VSCLDKLRAYLISLCEITPKINIMNCQI